MPARRACGGYCGVTWWISRPCTTPEETLTFSAVTLGRATGISLTVFITLFGTPFGKPLGIEPGISVVPFGGASSVLTTAMLLGVAAGGRNTPSSSSLARFAGETFESGLGATL